MEDRKYTDGSGTLRLELNRQYAKEGTMFETKNSFDCSGIQLFSETNLTEPFGYTFNINNRL